MILSVSLNTIMDLNNVYGMCPYSRQYNNGHWIQSRIL